MTTAIGQVVRNLRLEQGLSLRKAAGKCGICAAALKQIEDGDTVSPRASTLEKIAAAYGLDSYDIFFRPTVRKSE